MGRDSRLDCAAVSAKPSDWPRIAPVALTLMSLVAALVAAGVTVAAARRSTVTGILAAAAAVIGVALLLGIVGVARWLDRIDSWTPELRVASGWVTAILLVPAMVTAVLSHGAVHEVAVAFLAGAVFGAFFGSLLWRFAVVKAHRSPRPSP